MILNSENDNIVFSNYSFSKPKKWHTHTLLCVESYVQQVANGSEIWSPRLYSKVQTSEEGIILNLVVIGFELKSQGLLQEEDA